jgi:leucyl-tRNA synthetase
MHKTIKRVTNDYEGMRFNTMIAALMEYTNTLTRARDMRIDPAVWREAIDTLLLLLAPAAPHITEELWARCGRPYSIHQQAWPTYDAALAADETIEIAVQVNGKVRDRVTVNADADEAAVREAALASANVRRYVEGHEIARAIYVPGRMLNLVVK